MTCGVGPTFIFGCCYWVFFCPYLLCVYLHNNIQHSPERQARRRRKQATRPLPQVRPRALTLPPSKKNGLSFVKPKTYSNIQSPFFRLPLELRLMIYHEVLSGGPVHIVPMHRRLGSFLCTCPTISDLLWSSQHTCWNRQHTPENDWCKGVTSLYSYWNTGIDALPLLLTCRTIYSETVNLFYSDRTFDFRHLDGVLEFASSILPQRLHAITSLHLDGVFHETLEDWEYGLQCVSDYHRKRFSVTDTHLRSGGGAWEATCQVLAGMNGLRRLRLDLSSWRFRVFQYGGQRCVPYEERVFRPLREITQCDTFEIEIDWPETEAFKKGNAPFQLKRRLLPFCTRR